MEINIILAGIGGQGALSAATVIGTAALKENLFLKQSEVHGMSQRGGSVFSHLRLSDSELSSDLIPKGKADIILSMEPMESLRYLPFLRPDGWLITNTKPYENIPDYPDIELVYSEIRKIKNHILADAHAICKELHAPRSGNVVMLGAAAAHINIKPEVFKEALADVFEQKGENVVNKNIAAFDKGFGLQ